MSRSAVLRGMPVPKSRAKLRKRLDRDEREAEDDGQAMRRRLFEWIEGWLPPNASIQQLASLDLRSYVQASSHFDATAAERLRLLAVHLDDENLVRADRCLARWNVFDRVYEHARRLDPDDALVLDSMAITALELVSVAAKDDPGATRLWHHALFSARAACEIDDTDADLRYTLGRVLYFARPSRPEEALVELERALTMDVGHAWSRLYRAHCLHDLGRWRDAADAYGQVNAAAFPGHLAWRIELLGEQRAHCLLRAGLREQALAAFVEVLERREAAVARGDDPMISAALFEPPLLLIEAAEHELRPELGDRVAALIERLEPS